MKIVRQLANGNLLVEIQSEVKEQFESKIPKVEPFISLKEAAARLGVSAVSLWRWNVPRYEMAGRPRCRISEVEAYLMSEQFHMYAKKLSTQRKIKKTKKVK